MLVFACVLKQLKVGIFMNCNRLSPGRAGGRKKDKKSTESSFARRRFLGGGSHVGIASSCPEAGTHKQIVRNCLFLLNAFESSFRHGG